MLRRLGLCLGLLVTIVVLLPFATSTAHNLRWQPTVRSHHFRHHSRAWWRRHRALWRRRQAMIARRRALQAAARKGNQPIPQMKAADHVVLPGPLALPENLYRDGTLAIPLPTNWSSIATTKGASNFRIRPPDGAPEAQASLAVVAVAPPATAVQPLTNEQKRMLGGVTFTDLRRTVIEKMITAGGWVVNDRAREISGHRVFEVIAQTPATSDGKPEQVWNFYFTEINGRVYSLTTRSANAATQRVSADAEQFLTTFRPMSNR